MKWIPPGMLDRPSKILQWHQRIALSAYQSFRLMLLSFEKVIPKGMKKAKLKTLKCPNAKSGDFGWEPNMYILAHNPLELIDRTHQIVASL